MTTMVWFYMLGRLFLGPFTDLESCESARAYHLRQVNHHVVSVCLNTVGVDRAVAWNRFELYHGTPLIGE